jgi:uncharacterized protein YdiU (UPF0061 family)
VTKNANERFGLGRTIGENTVSSRKGERWITLGTPLRVNALEDADSMEELSDKAIEEHHTQGVTRASSRRRRWDGTNIF